VDKGISEAVKMLPEISGRPRPATLFWQARTVQYVKNLQDQISAADGGRQYGPPTTNNFRRYDRPVGPFNQHLVVNTKFATGVFDDPNFDVFRAKFCTPEVSSGNYQVSKCESPPVH
jgi:hypothetical protein